METLLWVVIPLLVIGLGWLWIRQLRIKNSAEVAASITPEAAQLAAAKLTGEGHRAVYKSLAQGDLMAAVQNYKAMTGDGFKASIVAVRSLERFPQIRTEPTPGPTIAEQLNEERLSGQPADASAEPALSEPGQGTAPKPPPLTDAPTVVPVELSPQEALSIPTSPSISDDEAWVVPTGWAEEFGSDAEKSSTQFKVSYLVDGVPNEFASEDLPPAEYDQFMSLVRDKDLPGAAGLIAKHSGLEQEEILRMLMASPLSGAGGANANIADFSFEGQGPDGAVHFSVDDLVEPERTEFLAHLRLGELDEATTIVARATGLPTDMVRTLLNAFGDGDK